MAFRGPLPGSICRRRTVVAVALVLWVTPATVGAQVASPPQATVTAEALIREATELRRDGHLAEALDRVHQAAALAPGPRPTALAGLLEQAMGRFADAEAHLEEALAATDDNWVHRNRSTLEPALADVRHRVGDLQVTGGEPGAEVVVDDTVRGTLPLTHPVRATAGSVTLEVRARGFLTVTRTVSITPGAIAYERVNMVRAASLRPDVVQAAVVTCARGLELRNGLCYALPGAVSDPRVSALRWVTWIGLGVTVTAGVAAGALGADGNSTLDAYVQDCGGPVAPAACLARYDQVRSDLSGRSTTVNILWGVAVVGAVASLGALVVSATLSPASDATASRPRVAAGPGGLGVVW